jgi:hypothetical protein
MIEQKEPAVKQQYQPVATGIWLTMTHIGK